MKKNIFIIILSVIVLCLGGYLVYDKLSNDNNEEVVNKTEYDLAAAKLIVDNVVDYNILKLLSENGLSEDVKMLMAKNNTKPNSIENCEIASDVYEIYSQPDKGFHCDLMQNVRTYAYDNINKEYKKLFGNSSNVLKKDVLYNTNSFAYSNKLNLFVELQANGSVYVENYYYLVDEASLINDNLKIKISYLAYYNNPFAEDYIYNYTINNNKYNAKDESEIVNAYNTNKDSLPTLTFEFKNENNNYILVSVKK